MANDSVKILIPLDGSRLAEHALAYVPALLPLGLSQVEIVSVIEPDPVPARRGHEDEERERNLIAAYHEKIAEEVRVATALDVRTKLVDGPAPEAILNEASAYAPDYLIISTHGSSGFTRWRFGSVADKVIRGADCPTFVVGPGAAERESWLEARLMPVFRSILVPLDGSPLAERALPVALQFADAFGARLHLVTAVELGTIGAAADAWAGVSPKLTEDLEKGAREYLERIGASSPRLRDASLAVRFGSSADALSDYMTENDIDLVIMTSHGRGGFVRTALGSTTDRLLGGSAPVLVIRAHDA